MELAENMLVVKTYREWQWRLLLHFDSLNIDWNGWYDRGSDTIMCVMKDKNIGRTAC